MEIKKDKIFELCAKTLDIPPEVVEHVWKSQFIYTRKWLENTDHPAIQLPSFGTFRINPQYIELEIQRTVAKLRKKRTEELESRLKLMWHLRKLIQPYMLRKKIPNNVRQIQTRDGDS